jgi:WD40 repeat protein
MVFRVYIVKDRLYQMMVGGSPGRFEQADADRAFNSFQVMPAAGPAPGPAPKEGPVAKEQPAGVRQPPGLPKLPGIQDFKFPALPKPPAIDLPKPPQPPLGRVTPPKPKALTQPGRKPSGEFAGHEGGIQAMAVSPKGDLLATGGDDKTVRLWSLPSGTQKAKLTGHNSPVVHVAVGPDGEVASAGNPLDRNTIIIWDVETGRPRATIPGEKRTVLALAFSPDGRYVASSHWETVKVWDAATGAEHYSKEYRPGVVHALAFSPDSKTLYAGAINGTIHVTDVEKKADRATWKGHRARVSSLAFAPGGRKLLSAGVIDAKLWDVASGQPDGSFNLPARLTESAAFSPDGKRIATVANGVVHLWDADSGRELRPADYAGRAKEALFLSDGRLAVAGSAPAVAVYAAD